MRDRRLSLVFRRSPDPLLRLSRRGGVRLCRLILRRGAGTASDAMVDSVIGHTITIHSLILALVFAQVQVNLVDIRRTVAEEAAAVADVFYGLDRSDPVANLPLPRAVAE